MELNLANAVQDFVSAHVVNNVFTASPARVVRVVDDLFGLQVDVQPLITYMGGPDKTTPTSQPVIYGVTVQMPSSRTSMLSFPVNVGDTVLLVFSHDNIDTFVQGIGTPTAPTDERVWSYMDCVAVPGWWPVANSPNNPAKRHLPHSTLDMVVAHNIGTPQECEIRLKPTGDIDITTPTTVNVKAPAVSVTSDTITVNTTPAAGTLLLNGVDWSTHTHTVTAVGSPTGVPI